MFARFRQSRNRLQVSIVETRRVAGKVRHEHIASLGSIASPPSVADRIAFWAKLHELLSRLSNRLTAEVQGKILGSVHARIPLPTPDEQRALQLENAAADQRTWATFAEMFDEKVAGQQKLRAAVERAMDADQSSAARAKAALATAEERLARLTKGGTVVGGFAKSLDSEAILRNAGWTKAEIEHCLRTAALSEAELKEFLQGVMARHERADRAAVRRILARRRS